MRMFLMYKRNSILVSKKCSVLCAYRTVSVFIIVYLLYAYYFYRYNCGKLNISLNMTQFVHICMLIYVLLGDMCNY